jgi:hypothetical protein
LSVLAYGWPFGTDGGAITALPWAQRRRRALPCRRHSPMLAQGGDEASGTSKTQPWVPTTAIPQKPEGLALAQSSRQHWAKNAPQSSPSHPRRFLPPWHSLAATIATMERRNEQEDAEEAEKGDVASHFRVFRVFRGSCLPVQALTFSSAAFNHPVHGPTLRPRNGHCGRDCLNSHGWNTDETRTRV